MDVLLLDNLISVLICLQVVRGKNSCWKSLYLRFHPLALVRIHFSTLVSEGGMSNVSAGFLLTAGLFCKVLVIL